MTDIFSKFAKIEKSRSLYLASVETMFSLVIGGFIGAILSGTILSVTLWVIFVILAIMYLGLLILRVMTQMEYPTAMSDEMTSKYDLDRAKKNIARKETIAEYIDSTIQTLNQITCSTTDQGLLEICKLDIKQGVNSVLKPVINLPNHILDVNKSSYTIGFVISCTQPLTETNNSPDEKGSWETMILRDNFNFQELFPNNLIDDLKVSGIKLELRNALQNARNNDKYFVTNFDYNGTTYTIITSPIPAVCEEKPPWGVLFMITEKTEAFPQDIERVLLIFGRILSNWLSKFDSCYQCKRKQSVFTTTQP